MDPGTAVGVASLGIQICDGMLKYYDKWRSYDKDIETTYQQITGLAKIFARLRLSLDKIHHDRQQSSDAKEALRPCETSLLELQELLVKLKPYNAPAGLGQRAWAQYRRAKYPLKASTLARVREIDEDIRDRLLLGLQGTQIDLAAVSQGQLSDVQLGIAGIDATLNKMGVHTAATVSGMRQLDATLNQVSLLTTSTANDVRHLEASVDQVSATADFTAAGVKALLRADDQRNFNDILRQFMPDSSLHPWLDFEEARAKHHRGTGHWLLASSSYESWKSAKTTHLWLHGKAGCGKTILCSKAIGDVHKDIEHAPRVGSAMFFFSFANEKKQSVHNMLLALIIQLAHKPAGLAIITAALKNHRDGTFLTTQLERIFIDQINALSSTFIFLDALDECPPTSNAQRQLLDTLQRLALHTTTMKLFMTSRDEWPIRLVMQEEIQVEMTPIDVEQTNHDIERYVASEIEKDTTLQRFGEKSKILVRNKLAKKADGMFRWAFCQLEELKKIKLPTPKKLEQVLSDLPGTLGGTYERMLARIDDVNRQEAKSILQWLMVQPSPMLLLELAEACIIDPESETVDVDDRVDPENIFDLLGSLVMRHASIVGEVRIGLAHFSVKEYLRSDRTAGSQPCHTFYRVCEPEAHSFVADSCLTYLNWYASSPEKGSGIPRFPLLNFTRRHWHIHTNQRADRDYEKELCLLRNETKSQRIWTDKAYGLRMAVEWNWPQVVRGLCCDTTYLDVIAHTDSLSKLLRSAATNGNHEVVSILLKAGADVNWKKDNRTPCLMGAASRDHRETVKELLDAGADVHLTNENGKTCLMVAASRGYDSLAEILLAAGADANHTDHKGNTCLSEAACGGYDTVTKILLEAGAGVNRIGACGRTSLFQAASRGFEAIAKVLIDAGSDLNRKDDTGRTAVMEAASKGHDAIVKVLLDAGSDMNQKDYASRTAMMVAASEGHFVTMQYLAERGADMYLVLREVQCTDRLDSHIDATNYLISKGAIPTELDGVGRNVLHFVDDKNADCVELLVQSGADIAAVDCHGYTPLLLAITESRLRVARRLLAHDADHFSEANTRSTALHTIRPQHWLTKKQREEYVDMLLLAGADIDGKNGNGFTPLLVAATDNDWEAMELLLRKGADITARTEKGETALMLARRELNIHCVQGFQIQRPAATSILVSRCDLADIETVDQHGRTTIHQAVWSRNVGLVIQLVDRGVDLNVKTARGNTPLAIAKQIMTWFILKEDHWTKKERAVVSNHPRPEDFKKGRQIFHELKQSSCQIVDLLVQRGALEISCSVEYKKEERAWYDQWLHKYIFPRSILKKRGVDASAWSHAR